MQLPTYQCSTHIYTLIIMLNETELYQQLFTLTDGTIVAPEYLQDNSLLSLKVLVGNIFNDTFYETGATEICKYISVNSCS